jgi:hypothetical protein
VGLTGRRNLQWLVLCWSSLVHFVYGCKEQVFGLEKMQEFGHPLHVNLLTEDEQRNEPSGLAFLYSVVRTSCQELWHNQMSKPSLLSFRGTFHCVVFALDVSLFSSFVDVTLKQFLHFFINVACFSSVVNLKYT